jgi:hypothetical protein
MMAACLALALVCVGLQAVPAFASSDTLAPGQSLSAGQAIWSTNGSYEAIMQGDGNFVLYGPSGPLWSSNTHGGNDNRTAVMQADGNFVIYGPSGALWASNTTDIAGVSLVVQNDSNLVLYAPGGIPLWDRHSGLVGSGKAIAWAKNYLGQSEDAGLCLTFVYDAWLSAGVNIGSSYDPVTYWNSNPRHYTKNTNQNPPAGALVFWGANSFPGGSEGHVAISLGGGRVISTAAYPDSSTNKNVFIFSLSQVNPSTYNYKGWMMP